MLLFVKAAKHERDFIRIVEFSTALSLGLMTGFLFSIKQVNPQIEFEVSAWAVLATIVSGVLIWIGCHFFFRRLAEVDESGAVPDENRKKLQLRWIILFSAVMMLETLVAVAHSFRGVSPEKLREVLQGAGMALIVLSFIGFVLWKVIRFIESDTPPPHLRDRDPSE